ncbi:MAG: tandem-95 repeat protein, partial [Planctomycetaceae bacterium]|nr:tandem-95 repeat protein [Planctomycetaceae bacterium]
INGVNDNPVADAGGPYTIAEGDSVTFDASASTDVENQALTYAWDLDNDGQYDDAVGVSPTLTWAQLEALGIIDDGLYTIGVQVTDSQGGVHTASSTLTVNNTPPTANDDAGAGYTTDEDTAFTTIDVRGNDTDPAAGDPLTVAGMNTAGTLGTVTNNSDGTFTYNPNGQFESLANGETATDSFQYTINDGDGGLSTATVTITINGVNDNPVADAGGPYMIAEGDSITLDASASTDVENQALTYAWDIDNDGQYDDAVGVNPTLTWAQLEALGIIDDGTYAIGVQVTDSQGGVHTASTTLTVNNTPPTANNDSGAGYTTDEDTSFTTIDVRGNDTDPASGDAVLTVIGMDVAGTIGSVTNNSNGTFTYDPNGQFETLANGETATDTFTYTVSDGDGGTSTAMVTITITGVNDAPIINDAIFALPENSVNGTLVGNVPVTDPDNGDSWTYSITAGNDNGAFAVDPVTGDIRVNNNAALDFEQQQRWTLTIEVEDALGATDTASIEINLTDLNDTPPVVTPGQQFSIPENLANGTSIGSLVATDADTVGSLQSWTITGGNTGGIFALNPATGELTISDNTFLDHETVPSVTLQITVSDGVQTSVVETVVITVTDVNEVPYDIALDQQLVHENAANGTVVGQASTSDVDVGDTFTYLLLDSDNGRFAINSSGLLTVADGSQLNYEAATSHQVLIETTDSGGLTYQEWLTIQLVDVNEAPDLQPDSMQIDEHSSVGTFVGGLTASDPDAGDILSFRIVSGNTGGIFTIDPANGDIRIADPAALVYEFNPVVSLQVEVSDLDGLTDVETIVIDVNNINDPPTGPTTLSYTVDQFDVLTITAPTLLDYHSDPDGPSMSIILLSTTPGGVLTLNPDGTFTYEADYYTVGIDQFTYVVTDGLEFGTPVTVEIDVQRVAPPIDPTDPTPVDPDPEDPSENDLTDPDDQTPTDTNGTTPNGPSGPTGPGPWQGDHPDDESQQTVLTPFVPLGTWTEERTEIFVRHTAGVAHDDPAYDRLREAVTQYVAPIVIEPLELLTVPGGIIHQLDSFQNEIEAQVKQHLTFERIIVGTTAMATGGLTVGYVIWLIRGGSLLATMLSVLPSWTSFDPLPVLEQFEEEHDEGDDDLVSLTKLK